MKEFFKMFFASLTAIIVSIMILSFVFIGSIVALTMSAVKESQVKVDNNSILTISTSEIGGDQINGAAFEYMDFNTMEIKKPVSTLSALSAIKSAASDDNIKAIVIINDPMMMPLGMAQAQEVRDALADFKKSGKKVYSYGKMYTNTDYYLASVADKVILCPEGDFIWNGLTSQVPFFKNLLEKVGIEVTAIKHGKYKSAIEPFTLSGMSDASREQNTALLNSVWGDILKEVSLSRGVSPEELTSYANNLTISSDSMAQRCSLVDALLYNDQFEAMLKESYGDNYKKVTLCSYAPSTGHKSTGKSKGSIAIIYAEGEIIDGESGQGTVGDRNIRDLLAKARKDDDIKAVVIRVNSPGGSALAAELIAREVELLQKEKPVIASFGNMAASGGYYISTAADVIVASPTTITGSIGVFGLSINAEKTLKDKLGIDVETINTNTYSDLGMPFRAINKTEEAFLQKKVDKIYTAFITRVSKGRNLSMEKVDAIAGGRVWSGSDAMKVGLVDGMGGIDNAIAIAAERAGLGNNFELTTLTSEKSFFYELLGTANISYKWLTNKDLTKTFGNSMVSQFSHMTQAVNSNVPQAMMPYLITIE
ncbi:MAG: signal peptide peptidase SppA [Rikenellaceae bacterium]